jgi:hypothetical protein
MTSRTTMFRAAVFVLALGYWIYQFFRIESWTDYGWQFRYLTIWTLTANVIVAAQMLRLSLGRTTNEIPAFVSFVVVMNISVVVNYWRLYLADPENFYPDGDSPDWWQEYYLHIVGPLLTWFDAFFIHGVFRRLKRVFMYAVIFGIAYPLWIEGIVAPLNNEPVGTVTSGLPYAFLNDMAIPERLIFYCAIVVSNFVFIAIGWGIAHSFARATTRRALAREATVVN